MAQEPNSALPQAPLTGPASFMYPAAVLDMQGGPPAVGNTVFTSGIEHQQALVDVAEIMWKDETFRKEVFPLVEKTNLILQLKGPGDTETLKPLYEGIDAQATKLLEHVEKDAALQQAIKQYDPQLLEAITSREYAGDSTSEYANKARNFAALAVTKMMSTYIVSPENELMSPANATHHASDLVLVGSMAPLHQAAVQQYVDNRRVMDEINDGVSEPLVFDFKHGFKVSDELQKNPAVKVAVDEFLIHANLATQYELRGIEVPKALQDEYVKRFSAIAGALHNAAQGELRSEYEALVNGAAGATPTEKEAVVLQALAGQIAFAKILDGNEPTSVVLSRMVITPPVGENSSDYPEALSHMHKMAVEATRDPEKNAQTQFLLTLADAVLADKDLAARVERNTMRRSIFNDNMRKGITNESIAFAAESRLYPQQLTFGLHEKNLFENKKVKEALHRLPELEAAFKLIAEQKAPLGETLQPGKELLDAHKQKNNMIYQLADVLFYTQVMDKKTATEASRAALVSPPLVPQVQPEPKPGDLLRVSPTPKVVPAQEQGPAAGM